MPSPPPLPRLVATDLDGTLLRSDGSVSERTQRTVARAAAIGIETVMITGRPARHVRGIAGTEGLGGLAICLNGSLLYDLRSGAVVHESRLAASVARELVVALRAHLDGICFAVEVGLDNGWEPSYARHRAKVESSALLPTADALVLCERGVNKLIAFHPSLAPDDFMARGIEVVADRASVSYSGVPFLEISARDVSKASALVTYCAARAIERERVIAFGDMPNDLPMLEWAGHSVAMANAHRSVLAAASEITLSNDEDGVALVLERLLERGGKAAQTR